MWATLVVAGSWLASAPARADDKGKAKVLMGQANTAFDDGGCKGSGGCDKRTTFQEIAAKYNQAVALDPSFETALAACDLYTKARGPDLAWAVSSGAALVALARCDYVAYHPDSSEALRKRGRDVGHMLRMYIPETRTEEEGDARRAAAAKALYGVGLTMKYDKKSNQISLDYGSLDAKTLQSYIGEYYTEYAYQVLNVRMAPVTFLAAEKQAEYQASVETGVTGWVPLEPMAKFALCKLIADDMKQGGRDIEYWCQVQQVIEANSPLFAFTGKAVKWNAGDLKGGGLTDDQRIFVPTLDGKYPVAITIAGPTPIDDYQHVFFLKSVAYTVKGDNPKQPEVLAMVARAEKLEKAQLAKWAKADAKVAGGKGKVVFADTTFESWEIPQLLAASATADCSKLYYKAYAPKGSKWYDAAFKMDGTTCDVFSVSSPAQSAAVTGLLKGLTDCAKPLSIPGEHTVTIEMHEVKSAKTGNRVIKRHGDGLKIEDEYMGTWGKKLGSWTVKCTTAGTAATNRFE